MSDRNPKLTEFLDHLGSLVGYAKTSAEASETQSCAKCGKDASVFRDEISAREYKLSHWCQKCQDEFWDADECSEDEL